MSASVAAGRGGRPRPARVIAGRTALRAVRSGALWGWVFGLTVTASAVSFASAYPTAAQRARVAGLFSANAGLAAIDGPARAIATVAGYTAWKTMMFLVIIGAVWGLLTGTRLLRGEEDAGRWELLLAGQVTPRGGAAQALAGLGAGLAALWTVTAAVTVAAGRLPKVGIAPGPMLFYAMALAAPAAMFLAVGALASQLASTRRQAAGYAGAALGASYALRMVADAGTGLAWLRWATPLGWVEDLAPLSRPRPSAIIPIAAFTIAAAGLAVYLAGRRDTGASLWPARPGRRSRTWLLGRPEGLAARLAAPSLLAWAAGIAAWGLLVGSLARTGGQALTSSAGATAVFARLGVHGASAAAFLGFAFLSVAWILALVAAGQVTALRGEEAAGRLDNLLARPVGRGRWLAARAVLAAAVIAAGGLLAGLLTWAGAASQGAGVSLADLLGAGLNAVPPALCLTGIGVLAAGAWPRAAGAVTYGALAWSVLAEIAGGAARSARWLADTSLFHYLGAAPQAAPAWRSSAVLIALAVAAAAAGCAAFARRDLAGE